ncbi:MAG: hypothetical protein SH817_17755 [Leptospira sp.]|nr:hypothetical protein [Leptospira sp.]
MTALEQTFDFSSEDLRKNKLGFVSESQNKKITKLEKIKITLGIILSLIFIILTFVCLRWYYLGMIDPYSSMIPKTKRGESIPILFFLILGIAGLGMSLFFGITSLITSKKIKSLSDKDSVKKIDAYIGMIEYGSREKGFAYLIVNQITLNNINSFRKEIFQPNTMYRFYYSEISKSLLSIEILSEETLQRF